MSDWESQHVFQDYPLTHYFIFILAIAGYLILQKFEIKSKKKALLEGGLIMSMILVSELDLYLTSCEHRFFDTLVNLGVGIWFFPPTNVFLGYFSYRKLHYYYVAKCSEATMSKTYELATVVLVAVMVIHVPLAVMFRYLVTPIGNQAC
ncbi:hypothetical protein [Methylocystis sp.]|uniref:hypothetical protein n=1 Tax=Methylocystis sp. TaxID=1911079 RepID=UPI003DA374DD